MAQDRFSKVVKIVVILVLIFFVWEAVRIVRDPKSIGFMHISKQKIAHQIEKKKSERGELKQPFVSTKTSPKITIVFIADAAGKGSIDKISPFLTGGIHFLQTSGVRYLNVFHPHANCSTAQGHASLTTGTFPCYHGMVNNQWLDANGKLYSVVQDNDLQTAGVFNPTNHQIYNVDETNETVQYYYSSGVSPRNYKVDNLSDELMIFSTPIQNSKVFSISSHQEPAVLMAGRLGKAFWMDGPSGLFTTSKFYFPSGIPDWVNEFNQEHVVPDHFVWNPVYPIDSPAYRFQDAQNYQYSDIFKGILPVRQTVLGKTVYAKVPVFGAQPYISSPLGIHTLYDFAKEIIDTQLSDHPNDRLILYVNHVAYDSLGGLIGPQTQDAIDIIYQLDKGIGEVIQHTLKKVDPNDCLFLFCSDEGYYPSIPELLKEKGFDLASRIITDRVPNVCLVDQFNKSLGGEYVRTIIPPFVYMNSPSFDPLSIQEQQELLQKVKILIRSVPSIKDAWTFEELISWPFEREDQARFFKLHLFRNSPLKNPPQERRSGEVIFQSFPYAYVTSNLANDPEPMFGVDHTSVYDYDAHTALYIYQPAKFEKEVYNQPVFIQQVAVSLAEILQVPRPSAASVDIRPLPGLCPKNCSNNRPSEADASHPKKS